MVRDARNDSGPRTCPNTVILDIKLAEAAGDPTPDKMRRLVNRTCWNPDAVRDDLRGCVADELGAASGVLMVDDTGFLKKGTRSAGVSAPAL